MSALEAAIHRAVKSGRLAGLTLWPATHEGVGWQGNARWADRQGWSVYVDPDPVAALVKALDGETNYDPMNPIGEQPAPAAKPEPVLKGGLFD
jgi:hypothetical protein